VKWSVIISLVCAIGYFGYLFIVVLEISQAFEPTYTKRDLIDNYNKNRERYWS